MDVIRREQIKPRNLPGRSLCRAFGEDAAFADGAVSMGFAHFSLRHGPMRPHCHESEIIYVLDARGARARYGPAYSSMDTCTPLAAGDIIRFAQGECHVFDMDDEHAFLDIIWLFGCSLNHTTEQPEPTE